MTARLQNIVSFLSQMDQQLEGTERVNLYLIGGGAITLLYDDENRTSDLDLIDPPSKISDIGSEKSALAQANNIYVSSLAEINFSAPPDWRQKCHVVELNLQNIRLHVPCVEDIVLGKMARLEPKDFEDIIALRDKGILHHQKLLRRLKENKKELKELGYRNNSILLFKQVFNLKLLFKNGDIFAK